MGSPVSSYDYGYYDYSSYGHESDYSHSDSEYYEPRSETCRFCGVMGSIEGPIREFPKIGDPNIVP